MVAGWLVGWGCVADRTYVTISHPLLPEELQQKQQKRRGEHEKKALPLPNDIIEMLLLLWNQDPWLGAHPETVELEFRCKGSVSRRRR